MDGQRRTLRERSGDPVTFRHVVTALPFVAAALVWFGNVVEGRAEKAAADHIEQSSAKDEAFREEIRTEVVRLRADFEELGRRFDNTEGVLVGKVDRLTELIVKGAIRIRRNPKLLDDDESGP